MGGDDGAQEVVRRLDAAAHHRLQVVDATSWRKRPVTTRPEDGGGGVDAAEARQPRVHQPGGGRRVAQVAHAGDRLDGRAQLLELVDQARGRITEHQVVPALGQQAGQRRADVEPGITDQGDPTLAHCPAPVRSSRAVKSPA